MIIGVVGTFAAGKDTVARYLEELGFNHISSGDVVRQYILDNDLGGLERDNLRIVANRVRAERGSEFFVREALKSSERPLAISGLRTSGEIEAVKDQGGIIIAVDAPINRRYEWAKARGRVDDSITPEKFKELEMAEESDKTTDCQISTVMSMRDFDVANDGSLAELHSQIDEVLKRMGWDEV